MSKLNPPLKPTPKVDTGSRLAGGYGAWFGTKISKVRVLSSRQKTLKLQRVL